MTIILKREQTIYFNSEQKRVTTTGNRENKQPYYNIMLMAIIDKNIVDVRERCNRLKIVI